MFSRNSNKPRNKFRKYLKLKIKMTSQIVFFSSKLGLHVKIKIRIMISCMADSKISIKL